MEEEFRALVQSVPGLDACTVDWGARPRGAPLPAVVLNVVSDVGFHTHSGPSSLSRARVQVDVYADTYGQAKRLARALRKALDGTQPGGVVSSVFLDLVRDTREVGDTPDTQVFRCMTDFQIWYHMAP